MLTIGFARRATPYKRADLIFSDLDRLTQIARTVGKIQIVFGGKAHPHDGGGKDLIRRIYSARERLGDLVKVVYVENYEMAFAATDGGRRRSLAEQSDEAARGVRARAA